MQPSALLLNTSHGVLVDSPMLAAEFQAEQVPTAGLGVVEIELPRHVSTRSASRVAAMEIAILVYYVREHFEHLLARTRLLATELEQSGTGGVRELIAHAEGTRPAKALSERLDVSVRYQACTTQMCLAPEILTLQLEIPITSVG